jgi:6-phosphogluconolactonase
LRRAYLVGELNSSVTTYRIEESGALTQLATTTTLPENPPANTGAEIALSDDARHLYVSNRGHDSIAVFDVDGEGAATLVQHVPTGGAGPRSFSLTAEKLFVANQWAKNVVALDVDRATGRLSPGVAVHTTAESPFFVLAFVR